METNDRLLEKYYKGDTSLEEEQLLKEIYSSEENQVDLQAMFGYFSHEAIVPEGLEDSLFNKISEKQQKDKVRRMWIYRLSSAAASVLIIMSIYLGVRNERYQQMENSFFAMEQALFQVSESLQPAEEEEMFVLWLDENVEIIIK